MAYYLGLDIGTSGTKALLITEEGRPVASDTQEYPLSTPRPLWAEQNPADWWLACVAATHALLQKASVRGDEIAGVGLSGQMHGSVFLDAQGNVLRPALLWCDQRTQAECDWITAQVGRENLVKYISNPVLTGFTAPKIVWLRNHEPEMYARVAKVLLPKDYIRYKLTGEFAAEVSDASGTALFDVAKRRWSEEMLAACDIPRAWMADCAESPEITAHISAEAAQLTGLAAGTPVAGGGGDQAAGAVGSGIVGAGVVSSTVGTSGVVFAHSDTPATDPRLRVHTFCHAVPGAWHTMGVVLSAGGSLRWLRDTLYARETAEAKADGREPYELMTEEAKTAPVGSEGLIFLPYLTGERTPYPDADARGAWVGLTLRSTRGHLARSVMEGVAFALNDTFEIFNEIGVPVTQVRASGGGAKSPFWRQIHADVTGHEHVTLGVDEGPALGAALLAAVGTGAYPTVADACRTAIQTVASTAPDAEAHQTYRKVYGVYRALYPALKDQFAAVSQM
ncbi:MAG: xylulokinase [Armatimonadota bacterium]|nr:xylulokinase [Armatimonadota bacterium]